MTIEGKKILITGAGRGLGEALAICAADQGGRPLLLGRNQNNLHHVASAIEQRTGILPPNYVCDLADLGSVAAAAGRVSEEHSDLDILVNSGALWVGGPLESVTDDDLATMIGSAVSGTIALTRRLLPLLRQRPAADIHTVVSMSGLQFARLRGSSVPFRAGKSAQDGFVQALTEELIGTNIRVTSIYPGHIEDITPMDAAWNEERGIEDGLTDRNVVEAILYILGQPNNVSIRSLVIERSRSEFLT